MTGVDGVEALLVKSCNETSVPSVFLIINLTARLGTNVQEPTSSRLAPGMEGVGRVGGGDGR